MSPPPVLNLAVGDAVVYGSHGIGCVEARRAGAGDLPDMVVLAFESGLRVTLPVDRAGDSLRSLSGEIELEDVQRTLRTDPARSSEPWSKRFRSMREKVTVGNAIGLAEVVRDGLKRERQLSGGRAVAGASERGLYLQARKLLAAEIAFARGIDAAEADMWIVEQIDEQEGSAGAQTTALLR